MHNQLFVFLRPFLSMKEKIVTYATCKYPGCTNTFVKKGNRQFCCARHRVLYQSRYSNYMKAKRQERKSFRNKQKENEAKVTAKCLKCQKKKVVNRWGYCNRCYRAMQRNLADDAYLYCLTDDGMPELENYYTS